MSSFTYSHRRKGPLPIKSGRFACGTTSQEQAFASSAVPVLDRLGIELDSHYDNIVNDMCKMNLDPSVYKIFREKYDGKDKELMDQLKFDSELVLLNNR